MKFKVGAVLGFVLVCATVLYGMKGLTPIAAAETPSEYVDMGFGMFPHFGINTFTNGLTGRQGQDPVSVNYPSTLFNPTDFDPHQWAAAAKAAGMKYMIYTVKHHFGWSGWDSAYTTYDVATSSVPDLDTVMEVKKACDDYGLKLVIYYSALDRTNYTDAHSQDPKQKWTNFNADYTQFVENQMSELLTHYGTIAGVWFDAAKAITHSQAAEIKNYIKSIQPDTLVMFHDNSKDDISDIHVQEEGSGLPPANNQKNWENAWYLNHNGYWSFNNNEQPQYTAAQIADKRDLLNNRNAAYALSVSPGPNGQLSTANYNTLLDVSHYLAPEPIPEPAPVEGWNKIDDRVTSILYNGNWLERAEGGAYNRSLAYSGAANSDAQFHFTGTGVKLAVKTGANAGKFDVYLDDVKVKTFDSYSSANAYGIVAYSSASLPYGQHTIKMVPLGTKNAKSSGYGCYLDDLEYYYATAAPKEVVVDDTDASITYSGTWDHISRAESYGGTVSWSRTANSSAAYSFYGTGIKLYTQKGPGAGIFNIYIDDVLQLTYDSYAPDLQYQVLAFDKEDLALGTHTIKFVATHTKNAKASNYTAHLDEIVALNP